ncbi:MAG: BamA/OMP85 family outer membrane protein [Calditrichia bacterium]
MPAFAQGDRSLTVEEIVIEGNSKTKASVIENYLDLSPGQTITKEQLRQTQLRLEQTNFFKDVELFLSPGTARGSAKLTLKVQERWGPYFSFRSGYNELDGWYVSPVGLYFDNLFGRGNIIGTELLIGDRIAGLDINYVRPFFFGSEYDFTAQIFAYGREFLHFIDGERFKHSVPTGGLKLNLSGNSGIARFFSVSYIAQNVDADSLFRVKEGETEARPVTGALLDVAGLNEIRRFVLTAKIDTRDKRIHPSNGWWGSISYDQSAKQLNSFADFYRFIIDVRRYQPLYKKMIAAARVQYGNVSDVAPFYEKFYLGGPNSLRGYRDRSLTPEGYASNMALASGEIRFPLSGRLKDPDRFTGVLFYDAGYVWNEPQTFKVSRLKAGIGAGVRMELPIIGLVRVDLAYPVPDYSDYQIHVSLGHTF